MHRSTEIVCLLATFSVVLLMSPTLADSAKELYSLADEVTSWQYDKNPERDPRLDGKQFGKLRSFNMSMLPVYKANAEDFLERLNKIDRSSMRPADAFNYDILQDMLETYIDGFRWWKFGWLNPVSSQNGDQLGMDFFYFTPLRTKADYETFIQRIRLMRTRLDEYTELIKEGIRLKRTYNLASLAKVPGQIDDLLVQDPVQFPIYSRFNGTLDRADVTEADRKDLRQRGAEAIDFGILQPFRQFKRFILREYIPNARRSAGVLEWDSGREYYKATLRWHLSLPLTPEVVHDIGIQEVQRIAQRMNKVMRSQNFTGSVAEFYLKLRTDPRFKLPSADAIINGYKHIIFDRIDKKLDLVFRALPSSQVRVTTMSSDQTLLGYYQAGVFYVNVNRPNDTNTFDMMSLALHETNPGHHFQLSYILDEPLADFRFDRTSANFEVPFLFPSNTAFTEGWALYAEALGEEMGLYKDNFELMGRFSYEMLRACRLVVDTGIHYYGWSRDDGIRYIANYTSFSRQSIEDEVDRYITFPGQVCAYKIGELKIWELRRKAETELGDHFDLKEFHATILNLHAVPLRFVEQAVDQMIQKVKRTMQSSGHPKYVLSPLILVLYVLLTRAFEF